MSGPTSSEGGTRIGQAARDCRARRYCSYFRVEANVSAATPEKTLISLLRRGLDANDAARTTATGDTSSTPQQPDSPTRED